jgi:hypothetical protein
VSWNLLSVAHTLQYNTIQDPCAVDTVDNSVSRSRLIMRKPLSRHFDDVVSNLQHNVLPGAHIDESHPSPNAFVQRSSLLDSKPSNGRFCSRKSLANGACCTDCNRSRRVAFDCVGLSRKPAIPPIRSKQILSEVYADGGTKFDSTSRTDGDTQQNDVLPCHHHCGTRSGAHYHTFGISICCFHKLESCICGGVPAVFRFTIHSR